MVYEPKIFGIDSDSSFAVLLSGIANEMQVGHEQFVDAESFLRDRPVSQPGCVVTEIRLRGMNGIELMETLRRQGCSIPVIVVTAHAETHLTVRAMQLGAITVLEKPPSHQEFWDYLRKALHKDSELRRIDEQHRTLRKRLSRLTQKERLVLDLLVDGGTNKFIANRLDVSVRTVEARRQQIFKKTRTGTVAELVKLIIKSGAEEHSDP